MTPAQAAAGQMTPARLGVLILAAGASRRFGPDDKLLHKVDGLPLAAHTARLAAALTAAITLAIIPENAPARAALFGNHGIDTRINPYADQGQGSSLAYGIRHLSDTPVEAALILLADMPHVPLTHLTSMLARLTEGVDAVASITGTTPLPPMLFRRSAFPRLARLEGDQGGKRVFLDLPNTATVPLAPRQAIDIDTRDDMSE